MAIQKTYTIPDNLVDELIEVFGQNYQEQVLEEGEMIDNPQTKAQFASEQFDVEIVSYVKNRIVRHRKILANQAINKDFEILTD